MHTFGSDGGRRALPIALLAVAAGGALIRASPRIHRRLVAIVPPAFPAPAFWVGLSGAAEAAAAVGLLVPRTRRAAATALALFLVAVFPANVRDEHLRGDRDCSFPRRVVVRGALQAGLVACAVRVVDDARRDDR